MHETRVSPPPQARRRSAYKTPRGLARRMPATRCSLAGLRAAFQTESVFRQELALGVIARRRFGAARLAA
jgi:hypothetical protein